MIANSHPYNPASGLAQQQRCVKVAARQQQNQGSSDAACANQFLQLPSDKQKPEEAASMQQQQQQQNALYGSSFLANSAERQSQNVFDLMSNMQQQQQTNTSSSLFDSAYGEPQLPADSEGSLNARHSLGMPNTQQQQQMQQIPAASSKREMSLYSPSSSTSLLYHIYDQINLPGELQTPIYGNGQTQLARKQPSQLIGHPLAQVHQNGPKVTTIQQHELYSGAQSAFASQQQFAFQTQQQDNQNHLQQSRFQNELFMHRMHTPSATSARHPRPLSSAHLLEGQQQQSAQLGYGRLGSRTIGPPGGKSSLVASIQQQQQHLLRATPPPNHCALDSMEHMLGLGQLLGPGAKLAQAHRPIHCSAGSNTASSCSPISFQQNKLAAASQRHLGARRANRWPQWPACKRLRTLSRDHANLCRLTIFLGLLALCLLLVAKLSQLFQQQQQQQASSGELLQQQFATRQQQQLASNLNPLLYPPPVKLIGPDQSVFSSAPGESSSLGGPAQEATQQQDLLRSKLLIGEFVVSSQNYSQSGAHKSLLAENLVKLMDQVFLSTDVRHVYSRMEVTNIRPNRLAPGLIVDCNIILSDSIAYAAQLFGVALYNSLIKSNERLANQASFVIDKNSIRFNTVPDKDLRSGLLPAGLLAPSLTRELAAAAAAASASPSGDSTASTVSSTSASGQLSDGAGQSSEASEAAEQQAVAAGADSSPVVWSTWSSWSSCLNKNGQCDPQRIHSRLRKCVAQRTGEKVEAQQCKQRFSLQDLDLELSDCAQVCARMQQPTATDSSLLMSDAPQGPLTAPSVLLATSLPEQAAQQQQQQQAAAGAFLAAALNANKQDQSGLSSKATLASHFAASSAAGDDSAAGVTQSAAGGQQQPSSSSQTNLVESSSAMPNLQDQLEQQQQQMSCSNCTSDEICLLLVHQKVPFCAKIKERLDESGCGGWCKQQSGQLCQPLGPGSNAFKCIHDSECLADEWRCHDSACIPLSKRCDGHSNCFDSSDERYCPA